MNRPAYPVLQEQDGRFVDVEFDRDFRFADAHVAVGAGRVQDTRDKKLLPEVGTLVQEDLEGKRQHSGRVNNRKRSVRREEHHDSGAKEPRLPDATVGPYPDPDPDPEGGQCSETRLLLGNTHTAPMPCSNRELTKCEGGVGTGPPKRSRGLRDKGEELREVPLLYLPRQAALWTHPWGGVLQRPRPDPAQAGDYLSDLALGLPQRSRLGGSGGGTV